MKIKDLSNQIIKLSRENAELRIIKTFIDRKIKTLTIFETYQNDIIIFFIIIS